MSSHTTAGLLIGNRLNRTPPPQQTSATNLSFSGSYVVKPKTKQTDIRQSILNVSGDQGQGQSKRPRVNIEDREDLTAQVTPGPPVTFPDTIEGLGALFISELKSQLSPVRTALE